jgi:hypothetical protein
MNLKADFILDLRFVYIGNVFTVILLVTATCDSSFFLALTTLDKATEIEMILIAKVHSEVDIAS